MKPKFDEAMQKLNLGLGCHVAGGSLMLLSSSFLGASPLPTAIFAGLLWMQIMSTVKVTELGAWVNLCKNVVKIERIQQEGESADFKDREKFIITTDGSKLSIEAEQKGSTTGPDDETDLPSLKQLKHLGILHLDESSILDSGEFCQELFNRDDILVTMNEGMKPILEAPPGAANTVIPKLAEIYQKRQKAIHGPNKRLATMIANAPPMDPSKMLDRLGTASMVMGFAVLVLGSGMYIGASKQAEKSGSLNNLRASKDTSSSEILNE